jgi:hypothetical protein
MNTEMTPFPTKPQPVETPIPAPVVTPTKPVPIVTPNEANELDIAFGAANLSAERCLKLEELVELVLDKRCHREVVATGFMRGHAFDDPGRHFTIEVADCAEARSVTEELASWLVLVPESFLRASYVPSSGEVVRL